ncbi:MAG: DUF58 domain-containing protein, partial [Candidatus Dependentiae bacterium]
MHYLDPGQAGMTFNKVAMNEQQLRAKIAHIHLVVRRLMNTALSGDFSSAFKGGGLEFAQLRNYLPGDDIRSIDW